MQSIVTWPFALRRGGCDTPAEGADAMCAINWIVHGKHGYRPECACPVIAAYVTVGSYKMHGGDGDRERQRFLPYLHLIAGSRSQPHEAARMRILRLAALRIFAPWTLDAAGLHEHAAGLRALPDDVDMKVARKLAWAAAEAARAAKSFTAVWAALRTTDAADAASGANPDTDGAESVARAASLAVVHAGASWDDYFLVLDAVLNAGPQGAPWTADAVDRGVAAFASAGGVAVAAA